VGATPHSAPRSTVLLTSYPIFRALLSPSLTINPGWRARLYPFLYKPTLSFCKKTLSASPDKKSLRSLFGAQPPRAQHTKTLWTTRTPLLVILPSQNNSNGQSSMPYAQLLGSFSSSLPRSVSQTSLELVREDRRRKRKKE